MGDSDRHYLITGATGNLGFALLCRLLRQSHHRLTALVRDGGERLIRWSLAERGVAPCGRLDFITGDISNAFCGVPKEERALSGITDLVHCAAEVRWFAAPEALLGANVTGTCNVLDLATWLNRKTKLNRITVVSSAYVSGVRTGTIPERLASATRFNNSYEASKFLMEREALARRELPVNVVRPGSIVGDSEDGSIQRFSTIYFPFRLVMENRLHVMPGYRDAVLDIVPSDYVAEAIEALHEQRYGPHRVIHVCGGARSIRVDEIWELACETFNLLKPQARPRRPGWFIPPAVGCRSYYLEPLLPSGPRQLMQRMRLYIPYLSSHREFETSHVGTLGLRPPPPLKSYVKNLCSYAIRSEFRNAEQRAFPRRQADMTSALAPLAQSKTRDARS